MKLHLVLGNKNYSSWSLRAWILLARTPANFTEQVLPLFTESGSAELAALCPAGLVPVLMLDDEPVWESLAILETVAELFPEQGFLPESMADRALMRSICAEMHSGFMGLRSAMPMNCRSRVKLTNITPEVQAQIARADYIWTSCRKRFADNGPWLFGHYTIADAMFAPLVSRFDSYQIDLSAGAKQYVEGVLNDPLMLQWYADSQSETWVIEESEIPFR